MTELNANLGHGASFPAVAAFDALLVALNSLLSQQPGHQHTVPYGLTGDLGKILPSTSTSTDDHRSVYEEYARLMLAPELPGEIKVDVLQESPWLVDGIVQVARKAVIGDVPGSEVKMKMGPSSGHVLKKSYLKAFFDSSMARGYVSNFQQ